MAVKERIYILYLISIIKIYFLDGLRGLTEQTAGELEDLEELRVSEGGGDLAVFGEGATRFCLVHFTDELR